MNTVENLKVNRRAKSLNKKTIFKLMIGVVIASVIAATPAAVTAHNNYVESKQKESIVAYYGEESVENNIIKYIDISEKLSKLDLEKFNIDKSLYKKYNISDQIKSPEELEEYIKKFDSINSYVSTKDINKQSQNIDIVLNLAIQEKLVNSYIYNIGYSTANKNITDATKKYAAEVFGVADPSNIYFNYHMDRGSGESNTTIIDKTPNEYGLLGKESYHFDNLMEKKEEKYINKGVISMKNTKVLDDDTPEDNDRFNKDRNDFIKNALVNSIELEEQVEEHNLYNEKLANKMK